MIRFQVKLWGHRSRCCQPAHSTHGNATSLQACSPPNGMRCTICSILCVVWLILQHRLTWRAAAISRSLYRAAIARCVIRSEKPKNSGPVSKQPVSALCCCLPEQRCGASRMFQTRQHSC